MTSTVKERFAKDSFIDALNEELAKGEISYDVQGMKTLCSTVGQKFEGQEGMMAQINEKYIPDLEEWLVKNI